MKKIYLAPIKETSEDFEAVEARLKALWKKELYAPIMVLLGFPTDTLTNAKDPLADALRAGRITYYRGRWSGRFNSSISKALERLGAKFDRKTSTYSLPEASLPRQIRELIAVSDERFRAKIAGIDKKLAQILPEKIADQLQVAKLFDSTLWKTNQAFKQSVKNITVAPDLTDRERGRIADEWQNNMKLWVKDWTGEEIVKLREQIQKTIFSGNRYESAVKTIQKSFGVSQSKAKFLARQETGLLMAKFKETRYTDAGVHEYEWRCVAGSKNHQVRPWHKALEGKIFRWDNPPITTKPGEAVRRNNPGQDFNCRCFAKPVIRKLGAS